MRISFRFYSELNDFLPAELRSREFTLEILQRTTVKDAIESLGIPHPEVDLVLINGQSRGFDSILSDNDLVSVFPMFEALDISEVTQLRSLSLRRLHREIFKFVVDVNLGRLAHYLRMLGFDTVFDRHLESDEELARISKEEKRILLTRDRGLLKRKILDHGYFVRNTAPKIQVQEVLTRFDLYSMIELCSRCLHCNCEIERIDKAKVLTDLPPQVAANYDEFFICPQCRKIYWKGTHYEEMKKKEEEFLPPLSPLS
jgi:hypothetical protein